jgi:hypothetical protein
VQLNTADRQYKKFFIAIVLLISVAICMVFAFNYVVDPYNFNRRFHFGLAKNIVSYKTNYQLFKIAEYKNAPCPNIMLGDSRGNAFDPKYISNISGKCFYNFSYPGGTMSEVFDTFWLLLTKHPLKEVYITFGFDLFINTEKRASIKDTLYLTDNKTTYYLSTFTTKMSAKNILNKLKGNTEKANTPPPGTKEYYWKYKLWSVGNFKYQHAIYPADTVRELIKMKNFCDKNGVKLTFIIVPSHTDFQGLVDKFGIRNEYNRYKKDLASISTTIDFDYKNSFTTDKNTFGDPAHFKPCTMKKVAVEVWNKKYKIGRRLTPSDSFGK